MTKEAPDCTMPGLLARLDKLTHDIIAIRAEAWLREWPEGHADRPKRMPGFVKQYLKDKAEKKERQHGP